MTQNQTKIQGKFYPLTPELAKTLRVAKLTAAEWRFWAYLVEIDPYGDRYHDLNPLTIQTECELSKPTYYRAKAKFQELGIFDFQEEKVSFRNLTGVSKMRQESQKRDSKSQKRDSKSQKRENQASKPAPDNDSSISQNIKTYSDFKETLSEEARANFLNFCEEKTKNLQQEVNDIEAWLAHTNKAGQNRWEVYYEKYIADQYSQAQKTQTQVATKNALDEFHKELEERTQQIKADWERRQAQKAAELQQNQTAEPTQNQTIEPTQNQTIEPTQNQTIEPAQNQTIEPTQNQTIELTQNKPEEQTPNNAMESAQKNHQNHRKITP